MKILFEDYTFNAATKEVTFVTTSTIGLSQLLIITNVTTNQIIYNFADPNAGGTIVNNVLTLDFDTTSMSNTDSLQIFLDNQTVPASNDMLLVLQEQNDHLLRMIKLLEPSGVASSAGRQHVHISAVDPAVLTQQYFSYFGAQGNTISTAESTFNLQSRMTCALIRQQLEFS